mmetsp:Transcript_15002/g.36236  ORF Transcript_15002/g.36236 Transcript_15002/m.36236 type:complete len:223 (+) Transcript_15002:1047-1715(+)
MFRGCRGYSASNVCSTCRSGAAFRQETGEDGSWSATVGGRGHGYVGAAKIRWVQARHCQHGVGVLGSAPGPAPAPGGGFDAVHWYLPGSATPVASPVHRCAHPAPAGVSVRACAAAAQRAGATQPARTCICFRVRAATRHNGNCETKGSACHTVGCRSRQVVDPGFAESVQDERGVSARDNSDGVGVWAAARQVSSSCNKRDRCTQTSPRILRLVGGRLRAA